jgi:hypothetical protein
VLSELSLNNSALADGANIEQTVTFEGLPSGSYFLVIWTNLEGDDGRHWGASNGPRASVAAPATYGSLRCR